MILFFILFTLFFIVFLCLLIASLYLSKNTKTAEHITNVDNSFIGVPSVVHYNASKTVESSVEGAIDTLNSLDIDDININDFYNSLNKKKGIK